MLPRDRVLRGLREIGSIVLHTMAAISNFVADLLDDVPTRQAFARTTGTERCIRSTG